jgi:hypothetical protein
MDPLTLRPQAGMREWYTNSLNGILNGILYPVIAGEYQCGVGDLSVEE